MIIYVDGLRTGTEDSDVLKCRGNVIKRIAFDDDDECEETEELPNDAFNLRVFSGVDFSPEQQPILISTALRLFMDSIDGLTTFSPGFLTSLVMMISNSR